MSNEQKKYLRKIKMEKYIVMFIQIFIVLLFFGLWEYASINKIINPFIFSSPSKIYQTIITLYQTGDLFIHILTTLKEIVIAFTLGIGIGFIVAIILYEFKMVAKIIDPFLTMLNSLPKVALGPIIIIWAGANTKSIIIMALLINLIVSIINIYNGFLGTDKNMLKLFQSFGASRFQILTKLVIPSARRTIISSLKLNISMTLIGVIMGEFLVSKRGIGYLIIYGTQIFNLNIVMAGILILVIISFIIYKLISIIENILLKRK